MPDVDDEVVAAAGRLEAQAAVLERVAGEPFRMMFPGGALRERAH